MPSTHATNAHIQKRHTKLVATNQPSTQTIHRAFFIAKAASGVESRHSSILGRVDLERDGEEPRLPIFRQYRFGVVELAHRTAHYRIAASALFHEASFEQEVRYLFVAGTRVRPPRRRASMERWFGKVPGLVISTRSANTSICTLEPMIA